MDSPSAPEESAECAQPQVSSPTFAEAFRFWLKLGFISFGGPTGQIAIMHAELVERRRWISEERFLHALNYCLLLPGPEAQQLAIYIGWLLHRIRGGLVAGVLFVLPSAFILWGLSLVYVSYGKIVWIGAAFDGLKPAVLAIVAAAALRLGRKVLKNRIRMSLAAVAFVALYFLRVPFPAIVLGAGTLGFVGGRIRPNLFVDQRGPGEGENGAATKATETAPVTHTQPSWKRAWQILAVSLALWWLPILWLGFELGWRHTLVQQGLFFSKASLITFGGAYAVLPYVSQQAVEHYGWLTAGQMLDGLGLAETTPGPLIMVLQFVGFLGGWRLHEPFSPLLTATLGAALTTWTTFVPCFLWIFLGAPYVERLRGNVRLNAVLSAITAAVVGVILNLAVWFGRHVLFPEGQPVNGLGCVIAIAAFLGLTWGKWSVAPVVLGAAGLGIVHRLVL